MNLYYNIPLILPSIPMNECSLLSSLGTADIPLIFMLSFMVDADSMQDGAKVCLLPGKNQSKDHDLRPM